MHDKPSLSFWQIWNMCFGFLGIQFGFALQNANVSRIFQTLGAAVDEIPILWLAAPLTGLLIQPIVGHMSDNTWTRLGRRRPYFVAGAVCATLALFIMPNSSALWMAAFMLWMMDAAFNITMEPFRAFVGDNLPDRQRTLGYVTQSFFIGIGAVVASMLPWILSETLGVSNHAEAGEIPDSVRYSFYIGAVVLCASVFWTVIRSHEYPPEEFNAFHDAQSEKENLSSALEFTALVPCILGVIGFGATFAIYILHLEQELYILSVGLIVAGVLMLLAKHFQKQGHVDNMLYQLVSDFFAMPKVMRQLALVQFFSWFALFAMWIYSTSAVTSFHFSATEVSSAAYNEGANWVGVLFAVYNGVAALLAFTIPILARHIGRKRAHSVCLFLGALGLISFYFIKSPDLLWISMIGVGIAWASILSLPYAILSSAIPAKKMGVYMGIFNFFIVLPQLLAASVLGILMKVFFSGEAIYALVLGGVFMICGGIASLFVSEKG